MFKLRPVLEVRKIARRARCVFTACATTFFFANSAGAEDQKPAAVDLPPITVTVPAAEPPGKKPSKQRAKTAKQRPPPEQASAPAVTDDPVFDPSAATQTTAGPVDGYRALSTSSATKSETPLNELPQSVQVVPRSLIVDQTTLGVDEAVQNVSGVQGTPRLQTPAYDMTTIRGFLAEQWLDGLPVLYNPGHRDAFANVERIEVLKGPNAVLYGGGFGAPIGGAVNVVSKLPVDKRRMEFGATVGTDNYYRPYFDINQPLSVDGSVLFRVTGEYLNAGSFVEEIETEAYSINPTLTIDNKMGTKLTLQGRATRWAQPEYQGLPAVGTVAGNFRIDPDLFIGAMDAPDSFSALHGITATLEHAFSDRLDATVRARWSKSEFTEFGQIFVGGDGVQGNVPLIPPSTWALSNGILSQEQEEFTIASYVRMKTAGPYHETTVLLGADYSRIADRGDAFFDIALGGAGLVDLTDPVFTSPYVEPPRLPATAFADATTTYVNQGLYVQIQSSLADSVHLLGGLRLADVETDQSDFIDASEAVAHETRLLPRLGALVDVTTNVSLYASYSEGMQGHYLLAQRNLQEPQFSQQREAGLKFDLGSGLTGTAAVFEIDRTGVPVVVNFVGVGTSEETSRGYEFDAIWQPDRNWRIVGSYAHIEAELVKPNAGALAGARRVGIPEHSGRLWINYAFDPEILKGWSVGAGFYAASGQPVDLANRFFTDSYVTVDAKLAYTTDAFTLTASAKNLLDEDYFVSHYYLGGRVARGDERAFYLTLSHTY